jgi:hypothetical protein
VSKSQNALRKVRGSLTTEGAELGSKILRVFREVGLSPQRPQDLGGAYIYVKSGAIPLIVARSGATDW